METYSKFEILDMDEVEFATKFKNAEVDVICDDDSFIKGTVNEIILAPSSNCIPHKNQPARIAVDEKYISIEYIKQIVIK